FPRAFILGFGYAEGIFTWLAMSCRISDTGYFASHINQSQSNGSFDSRVGASPRSKKISTRVEAEGFNFRTVLAEHRSRSVCRRLHAVESKILVQKPLNGGKDQGKVIGYTSGHNRVHSKLVDCNGIHGGGQQPKNGIRSIDGLRQHRANISLGRRDNRKTVRPPLLMGKLKNFLHSSVDG